MSLDTRENNCWEFWNCPPSIRDQCPAFIDKLGQACWLIAQSHCPRLMKGKRLMKGFFKSCDACPWHQEVRSREVQHK
ncbi:MAG: hypothetical protein A3I75_00275 [Deltaproteobacteria bacterium RIFCSPLOWO2_02_FULL_50_16]|nr:MAG: hypothetical protein A2053_04350 [Deltaproteobacteria bacterium GWA2_50_8]OGQ30551.1 MAG: hypothetical protein A3B79_05470 [Deltaproteobacteria bacterium RIFCSPHIGHO2_02_FULL_50_15]OGQ58483.1 MAG: hypothetical protein A3I75_00275 [Deltaproteobacteria bacterium RIFCSPLOWO2_02_FULL_50_16]OGQ67991.1 MAG: hypothetical protein A3F89_03705 [Deltaproteobacteria bacterium RIFCSPLOWO2_12_FULL_50_11]